MRKKYMKHTATAVIVALPLVCAAGAVAGSPLPQLGVFVSRSPGLNNSSPYASAGSYGTGPGNYQASMVGISGISGNLNWLANNGSNFVGTCTGVPNESPNSSTGVSRTVIQVDILTNSTFAISYNMSQLVRAGNEVSWGLTDLQGNPTYYVSFINGTPTIYGDGLSTNADASFTATVPPASYLLIMNAQCDNTGGTFSYDATFTAVPAPGVFPAILMAVALRGRRRR